MTLVTGSFTFNPAHSVAVQNDLRQFSLIQQFARRVEMTYGGAHVTIFDTEAEGGWVATEAGEKPKAEQTVTATSVALREWARIVPVSNRVVDANPDGVLQIIQRSAYSSLARAFDVLAFTGVGALAGSAADSLASVTKTTALQTASGVGTSGTWTGLNDGLKLLADDNKEWSGSLWDNRVEVVFNNDVDGNGRPLYLDTPLTGTSFAGNRPGRVLGRPADFARNVNGKLGALINTDVVGYAGDWSRAVWGTVGDIKYSVSDQASWTDNGVLKSAYEHNVTLFRVEAFIGFKVLDPDAFVKYTLGSTV